MIGEDAAASSRFGVAVSGGPDSMALLWLAAAAFPGRVEAATVDHRLRKEAADEAAMVGRYCAGAAIPHAIMALEKPIDGNVQSGARAARYARLQEWRAARGLDWLLTAHHADDQLETLLMRLNRASGVGGLAGVRGRNGAVLRPLLGWRKAELAALVEGAGVPHVHDPSNEDLHYDRNALRARLRGVDWLDPVAASRSAMACGEAEEALEWMVDALADLRMEAPKPGMMTLRRPDVPRELQRRLIVRMLAIMAPETAPPRGEAVDRVLERLEAGGKASLGRWLFSGGAVWRLEQAPARRSDAAE